MNNQLIENKRNLNFKHTEYTNCQFNNLSAVSFMDCTFTNCTFNWHVHTHYYNCMFVNATGATNSTSKIIEPTSAV